MIHVVVLGNLILFMVATILLVVTFLVWKRDGQAFLGALRTLLSLFMVLIFCDFIVKYTSTFILFIDPFVLTSPATYFQKTPFTYCLLALETCLIPASLYSGCLIFDRLVPKGMSPMVQSFVRRIVQITIVLIAVKFLVDAVFPQPDSGTRLFTTLFDSLVQTLTLVVEVGVLLIGVVIWLRERQTVEPEAARHFGDGFLVTLGLLALILVGTSMISIFQQPSGTENSETVFLILWLTSVVFPAVSLSATIGRYAFHSFRQPAMNTREIDFSTVHVSDEFCQQHQLTAREREVCDLLLQGLPNKEICLRLGITHGTVKNHVHNLFGKLKIQSRFELQARVRRR